MSFGARLIAALAKAGVSVQRVERCVIRGWELTVELEGSDNILQIDWQDYASRGDIHVVLAKQGVVEADWCVPPRTPESIASDVADALAPPTIRLRREERLKRATSIDAGRIVAALRPLEKIHVTLYGESKGFFMSDATRAFGSVATASEAIAALMLADMLSGEFVVIEGDDAHTLYRLTDVPQSSTH